MRTLPARLVAGLGAGALMALAFPPYSAPVLLPFGVALLLVALRDATPREGAYTGFACGLIHYGATLFWLANLFGAAAITLCCIAAAFTGLFGALYAWLRARLPAAPIALLAAVAWCSVEYYRSELFVLRFGWMGFGYGVIGLLPMARAAAWVGTYGLSFIVVLLGAQMASARPPATGLPSAWRTSPCAIVALGVWLVICAASWIAQPAARRMTSVIPVRPITIRLVQAPSEDTESQVALSRGAAGSRVDAIVWPEYSFLSDPTTDRRAWPQVQRVAREARAWLVFGGKGQIDPQDEYRYRNTAFVLAPDGAIAGRHVKNHTVHLVRDGIPAEDAHAIPTTLGRLGVAICFDMDFPDVARRLAADGAEVFLVPSMDPQEWGPVQREQHRLVFRMRAAECGRWLARADVAGGTSAVAPGGVEFARVHTTEPTSLDVTLGRETGRTPYVRFGWLFGPACLFGLAALCAAALWAGWRAHRADRSACTAPS